MEEQLDEHSTRQVQIEECFQDCCIHHSRGITLSMHTAKVHEILRLHHLHERYVESCNCEYELRKANRGYKRGLEKRMSDNKVVDEWLTTGTSEDYDIDEVLKSFEDVSSKEKKSKSSKSKKKKRKNKLETIRELAPLQNETNDKIAMAELIETTTKALSISAPDTKIEVFDKPNVECSICFCDRIRTFALVPCGHATFCEDCATRILVDVKKCPTCQCHIDSKLRVFT